MENMLYKNDRIVLSAKYADLRPHRHYSKHILISDKPFLCMTEKDEKTANSMVIQSWSLHWAKRQRDSLMVVFLIDETSRLSKIIDDRYLSKGCQNSLEEEVERGAVKLMKSKKSLEDIDRYVMSQFQCDRPNFLVLDERISEALKYIEEEKSINKGIYDLLSEKLCLSKSRFLHLFKEEMGIDLKNYLLLKRMEKAYALVVNEKKSITEAAIASGFSSSSHFSRACTLHYGISLTDFLKAQKI